MLQNARGSYTELTVDRIPVFVLQDNPKLKGVWLHAPTNAQCTLYWEDITVKVEICNIFCSIFRSSLHNYFLRIAQFWIVCVWKPSNYFIASGRGSGIKTQQRCLFWKQNGWKWGIVPFPCAKPIPKNNQTSAFSIFQARESFLRNGAPFAGELTRRFSTPRYYTYVLSILTPKTSSRPCVG